VLPGFGLILAIEINVMELKTLSLIGLEDAKAWAFDSSMNSTGSKKGPHKGGFARTEITTQVDTKASLTALGHPGLIKRKQHSVGELFGNSLGDRLISVIDGQPCGLA
jgi:hypothetical protein